MLLDSLEGSELALRVQKLPFAGVRIARIEPAKSEDKDMKKLILLAGAAALASTGPLAAKPGNGHAKGQSHGNHAMMIHGGGHAKGHGHATHAMMKHGGKANAKNSHRASRGILMTDRYGRLYALDARGSCPPGLAKRHNGCTPPGQAKRRYTVGQRYNRNFGNMWTYSQVPYYLRTHYNLDQSERYYYNNGYVYQVDPRTMLIQQVISAILR